MKRLRAGWIVLVAVMLVAGCGGKKGPAAGRGFRLASLEGDTVSLDEFKGKVVLLDFWATRCPPCRQLIPHLVSLHEKYAADGLVVLGISSDDSGAMQEFRNSNSITYKLLIGDNETMQAHEIKYIPTTCLYDRKGTLVKREVGFDAERVNKLETEIKRLLSEK